MSIHMLQVSKFMMRILTPLIILLLVFLGQIEFNYEIVLFPIDMIPVAMLSWEFGWKGTVISTALAVALWALSNILSGEVYSVYWYGYYNGIVRGAVCLAAGIFVLMFKRTLEVHHRRMDAMRSLLNICHGCGAVQGSDGRWIPMDRLLKNTAVPIHECPGCSQLAGH